MARMSMERLEQLNSILPAMNEGGVAVELVKALVFERALVRVLATTIANNQGNPDSAPSVELFHEGLTVMYMAEADAEGK